MNMRTTLLQRLKPELVKGLEDNRYDYPMVISRIETALEKNIFYSDLTIDELGTLFSFSNVDRSKRSSYDWRFGEDVFETYNEVC